MCGIFGSVQHGNQSKKNKYLHAIIQHSQQRGSDSSGLVIHSDDRYNIYRSDEPITKLVRNVRFTDARFVMGHSRLITDGLDDNQPIVRDGIIVIHNGIIVNCDEIWQNLSRKRELKVDTEVINAIVADCLEQNLNFEKVATAVLDKCHGVVACAVLIPEHGKLILFSNNGSLYCGTTGDTFYFASEQFPLRQIGCTNIEQIYSCKVIDVPLSGKEFKFSDKKSDRLNLIPNLEFNSENEKLLEHSTPELKRCTKCILPETMPFIEFDKEGVCNYCKFYQPKDKVKSKEKFLAEIHPYRRNDGAECILPLSGGRDSCYALHIVMNEVGLKPITYTYDWGMVTDLGRRNVSRMCSQLGVENIIVAANIKKKRDNIRKNLTAWLKKPHLGMVNILTAGDKHFFKYVEYIKKQTQLDLNIWGASPLETTHFKTGFLGMSPHFNSNRVYMNSLSKQFAYQKLRFKAMLANRGYFNSSITDTLSGEYHRSFTAKNDYFDIFNYWEWDESQLNETLDSYQWERAPDTTTTWRIGDGTAAFYNYIYYVAAGFTEHDTFRSNQIREGVMTREEALALVHNENRPRYANIKWYLDTINMDFATTIKTVNEMPREYKV